MTTIGEMVPELHLVRNRREEVKTLKAMLDAALTVKVVEEIARTSYLAGLREDLYQSVGIARARLQGRISNNKGGDERILYPSVYRHPQTKHRYMVSNGRVVQDKSLTLPMIEKQGYKFAKVLR